MFCGNCGHPNEDGAVVCSNCGERLDKYTQNNTNQNPAPEPPKKKGLKWWQILLIVLGALMGLGVIGTVVQVITGNVSFESSSSDVSYDFGLSSASSKYIVRDQTSSISEKQASELQENYIASCESLNYRDLLRNPENYIGKKIKITVKIAQTMSGGLFSEGGYRGYEDYELGASDTLYQNEWYLQGSAGDLKILNQDIVTFYGEFTGTQEMTRSLTKETVEIPVIEFKYYAILNQ